MTTPASSQVTTDAANKTDFQWWNPIDWFQGLFLQGPINKWFGTIGGDIASGLEGGFIAILKDLWQIILPWLEVLAGIAIIMWALTIYFRSGFATLIRFAAVAAK